MSSTPGQPIRLTRDCEVVQIPEGLKIRLARGTEVRVMQALGDTYTLMTEYHTMVRLEGTEADAIGREKHTSAVAVDEGAPESAEDLRERVWNALRYVYDPEIPVNVVDLGLVYKNDVEPDPSGQGFRVAIDLTLTAPGCGMGDVLKGDAERRVRALAGVKNVEVMLVVEPPWDASKMSESAKLELGLG
jgi:probable FeS assembly SUF system protein SufT